MTSCGFAGCDQARASRISHEVTFARLLTPAAKYQICKAGAPFVAESMEVLGGIGYCEASELPRLYRDIPAGMSR